MLDHLHIKNFLAFKDLKIDNIGQVNLITGKNNTGKTCLLDAIRCHESAFDSSVVNNILSERGLFSNTDHDTYKNLFNNEYLNPLHLIDETPFLKINDFKVEQNYFPEGRINVYPVIIPNALKNPTLNINVFHDNPQDGVYYLPVNYQNEIIENGWERIVLTPQENDLYAILQEAIDKNIIQINLGKNFIKVKLQGLDKPVPINTLGEGVKRVLNIAIALINSKGCTLLIDEIESGLHFSVLEKLWKIIFKNLDFSNSQLFVTTHSNDAIKTFVEASEKMNKQSVSRFIRLQHKRDKSDIEAITYEYDIFSDLVHSEFELR